jgi:hypothetical protein
LFIDKITLGKDICSLKKRQRCEKEDGRHQSVADHQPDKLKEFTGGNLNPYLKLVFRSGS